jgi:hypothetical protein
MSSASDYLNEQKRRFSEESKPGTVVTSGLLGHDSMQLISGYREKSEKPSAIAVTMVRDGRVALDFWVC